MSSHNKFFCTHSSPTASSMSSTTRVLNSFQTLRMFSFGLTTSMANTQLEWLFVIPPQQRQSNYSHQIIFGIRFGWSASHKRLSFLCDLFITILFLLSFYILHQQSMIIYTLCSRWGLRDKSFLHCVWDYSVVKNLWLNVGFSHIYTFYRSRILIYGFKIEVLIEVIFSLLQEFDGFRGIEAQPASPMI